MKVLKTSAICVLLTLLCAQVSAQKAPPITEPDYSKPHIFSQLPVKMNIRSADLENLFAQPVGATVSTWVSDQFLFKGVVVSKSDLSVGSATTVVVKSNIQPDLVFTFTKAYREDGTFRYLGRMLGKPYGDALEIVVDNGQYVFQKTDYYKIISE